MRTILDIYEIMKEVRERIIDTMRKRGLKNVSLVMSKEEFAKESGFDMADEENWESDYDDYVNEGSPYVTYWDKYGRGVDYSVRSVELVKTSCGEWRFQMACYSSEEGSDTFFDYDVSNLTMINVYSSLEVMLNLR